MAKDTASVLLHLSQPTAGTEVRRLIHELRRLAGVAHVAPGSTVPRLILIDYDPRLISAENLVAQTRRFFFAARLVGGGRSGAAPSKTAERAIIEEMQRESTMTSHESTGRAFSAVKSSALLEQLRRWWRSRDTSEEYLADAVDLADVERRLRVLERAGSGPAFVTFNH